ncbi:Protein of unknown function [Propionibacterium freudenreichii]|nr:Protein of unknown function [Propionibacterium freudenreichii]
MTTELPVPHDRPVGRASTIDNINHQFSGDEQ